MSEYRRESKATRIANKSDGCCYYCGLELTKQTSTYDHVVPRSRGGRSTVENLVLACSPCNNKKSNMSLDDYRERRGGQPFYGERMADTALAAD